MEARLEDGEIYLAFEGTTKIDPAVCQLCAILSITTCAEVPCFIFVKPFLMQMRWTAHGRLEERNYGAPTWLLKVFQPVYAHQYSAVVLGPHLFGVETLINRDLVGFSLSSDLQRLLKKKLVHLRTRNGQLTISLDSNLRDKLQQLLGDREQLDLSLDLCNLCNCSTPDPYAAPLWMFHNEMLHEIFSNDVLPVLAIADLEQYRISMHATPRHSYEKDTNRIISKAERALRAYSSANILDTPIIHTWFASSSREYKTYTEQQGFRSLRSYLELALQLLQSISQSSEYKALSRFQDSLPDTTRVCIKELILKHVPYGHLVILDLYRKLEYMSSGEPVAITRTALRTYVVSFLRTKEKPTTLDRFLEAAFDQKIQHPRLDSLIDEYFRYASYSIDSRGSQQIVAYFSIVLGSAFYHSQLRDFTGTIKTLEPMINVILRTNFDPGIQLLLVATCELMYCYNAVGHEKSAVDIAKRTMDAVRQNRVFHHILHRCFPSDAVSLHDLQRLPVLDESRTRVRCDLCHNADAERNMVASIYRSRTSWPPLTFNRGVGASQKMQYQDSQSRNLAVLSGASATRVSGAKGGPESSRSSTSIKTNLDVISTLQVVLADSYIGGGLYDDAMSILMDLTTSMPIDRHPECCLIALRLCKIMRRKEQSPFEHPHSINHLTVMSSQLKSLPVQIRSMFFDEIMSNLPQYFTTSIDLDSMADKVSASLDRLHEIRSKYVGLDDHQQDIVLLRHHTDLTTLTSTDDEKIFIQELKEQVILENIVNFHAADPSSAVDTAKSSSSELGTASTRSDVLVKFHQKGYKVEDLFRLDSKILDSLLHKYVKGQQTAVVSVLLQADANVCVSEKKGRQPLHYAASCGHIETTQLLLAHGADIRASNKKGQGPLHLAVHDDHMKVAQLLLTQGADVHASYGKENQTHLHVAVKKNYKEIARLLIQYGTNVDAVTNHGWTPLHFAVSHSHAEVVKLLVEHGADVKLRTKSDQTALQIARESSIPEHSHIRENSVIVRLLLSYDDRNIKPGNMTHGLEDIGRRTSWLAEESMDGTRKERREAWFRRFDRGGIFPSLSTQTIQTGASTISQ